MQNSAKLNKVAWAKLTWLLLMSVSLIHGCGTSAASSAKYIGSWKVVSIGTKKGPIKPSVVAVWTFKEDLTFLNGSQKGTWKEENGILSVITPRLTYKLTPTLKEGGNQLILTPAADFAGGQVGPITLQKVGN